MSSSALQDTYPYIDSKSLTALEEVFQKYNASAGLSTFLEAVQPVVTVTEQQMTTPHDSNNIGRSRAGGGPDLLSTMEWPRNDKGEPLAFLYQMNLKDIAAVSVHAENLLPKSGLLLFFYDYENQPWGFDPKDRRGWKVIFVPEEQFANLKYRKAEYEYRRFEYTPSDAQKNEALLAFRESYSMPPRDSLDLTHIGFPKDRDVFVSDFEETMWGRNPQNYFFGHPILVQGNGMQREAQMASNGIYIGGAIRDEDLEKYQQLLPGEQDWILLFQESTYTSLVGHEYGDTGTLYFWIRKQDLVQKNFDKVWVILQSS